MEPWPCGQHGVSTPREPKLSCNSCSHQISDISQCKEHTLRLEVKTADNRTLHGYSFGSTAMSAEPEGGGGGGEGGSGIHAE